MRISDWSSDVCSSDLRGADAGRLAVGPGHHVLADLVEAEAAVEHACRVAVVLDKHLAGHLRVAQFGVALHVGVERAAQAAAAAAGGHHDAVDVEETLVALAEPAEIAAVMAAFGAETHQEARQRAVAHGAAEIFRGVEDPAPPRGPAG